MRQNVYTPRIIMDNIGMGQQLSRSTRAPEASPMPRPTSVPLRQEILRLSQSGIPLTRIAADLVIPYGTVRNICRLPRREQPRDLAPDYRSCGRPVLDLTRRLLDV